VKVELNLRNQSDKKESLSSLLQFHVYRDKARCSAADVSYADAALSRHFLVGRRTSALSAEADITAMVQCTPQYRSSRC
jgi:hypothetical protein